MLGEKIVHECVQKLLNELERPSPDDMEAVCMLLSTVGQMMDTDRSQVRWQRCIADRRALNACVCADARI